MTKLYNPLHPQALTRVWLQTTDRHAPLRAIWIVSAAQPSATPQAYAAQNGGDLLCA